MAFIKAGLWCYFFFFLISNVCGMAQPTLGDATLGYVVLGYKSKQAQQARESKTLRSIPLWFLLQFWPPNPCPDFPQQWIVNWK